MRFLAVLLLVPTGLVSPWAATAVVEGVVGVLLVQQVLGWLSARPAYYHHCLWGSLRNMQGATQVSINWSGCCHGYLL